MDLVGPGAGVVTPSPFPALLAGLCDDAAVFPPGSATLPDAVRAYRQRRQAWYADLAGPLVLTAARLPQLTPLLSEDSALPLSLTFPDGPAELPGALAAAAALPVDLRSVEVALPAGAAVRDQIGRLESAVGNKAGLEVYVEIPRDGRASAVLEAVTGRFRAKLRTGGVRADLYPDESELADTITAMIDTGTPFKATAGLHHATRNTDPETGFEQHGFLNVLLAAEALTRGGVRQDARDLLAERDGKALAGAAGELDATQVRRARSAFTSFGTCSITDPVADLVDLGLLTAPGSAGSGAS